MQISGDEQWSKLASTKHQPLVFEGGSSPSHDEVLSICPGNKVVWSSGGKVLRSYSPAFRVVQSLWCTFADFQKDVGDRALCILGRQSVSVYALNGDVFSVALPCKAKRVWAMLEGLLIERLVGDKETEPDPEAPIFFSLLHPLEELKPVAAFNPYSIIATSEILAETGEFMCDPYESIVFVSDSEPFILLHNAKTRQHSLWVIRQSRAEMNKRIQSDLVNTQHNINAVNESTASSAAASSPTTKARMNQSDVMNASFQRMFAVNEETKDRKQSSKNASFQRMFRTSNHEDTTKKQQTMLLQHFNEESGTNDNAFDEDEDNDNDNDNDDDEIIHSEIWLQCVWKDEFAVPPCSSAFLSSDGSNNPLFCLFTGSKGVLSALRIHSSESAHGIDLTITHAFDMQVRAAVPIRRDCTSNEFSDSDGGFNSNMNTDHQLEEPQPPASAPLVSLPSAPAVNLSAGDQVYNCDILVLHDTGRMSLFVGNKRLYSVDVEYQSRGSSSATQGEQQDDSFSSLGFDNEIMDFRDPVSNRVTVCLASGRRLRAVVPTRSNSPLVSACFDVITSVFPARMAHACKVDYFAWKKGQLQLKPHMDDEWDVFAEFLPALLAEVDDMDREEEDTKTDSEKMPPPAPSTTTTGTGMQTPARRTRIPKAMDKKPVFNKHSRITSMSMFSPPMRGEEKVTGDAAWLELLSSTTHHSTTTALPFGILSASSSRMEKKKSSSDAALSKTASSSTGPQKLYCLPTMNLVELKELLPLLLKALHIVYEDLKLNSLMHHYLRPLAELLKTFAFRLKRLDFVAHYLQDFDDMMLTSEERRLFVEATNESRASSHSPQNDQPASIYTWMLNTMRGTPQPPYSVVSVANGYSCELSRKICLFYETMAQQQNVGRYSLLVRQQKRGKDEDEDDDDGHTHNTSHLHVMSPLSPFSTPHVRASHLSTRKASPPSGSNINLNISAADLVSPVFSPSRIKKPRPTWEASNPAQQLVLALVQEQFTLHDLELLPFGVALPIREALRACRNDPPSNWPKEAYHLVGRDDLASMTKEPEDDDDAADAKSSTHNDKNAANPLEALLASASASASSSSSSAAVPSSKSKHKRDALDDGTTWVCDRSSLRFNEDLRIKEVARLLRSTTAMCVRIPPSPESTVREAQEKRLQELCKKNVALCVGRGMFTMASISPVLTDTLPIPPIVLKGRAPPKNTEITLPNVNYQMLSWPLFHNGVAAGLRISSQQNNKITRTWIVYNRPGRGELSSSHAGFLLALGLQGQLTALAPSDFYWYLSQDHHLTTISVLLGMAAAKRGTMDTTVSKMLCLHIPTLLPARFNVNIPFHCQTASVLGLGLLYQGTCHRLMIEVLLEEIAKPPSDDCATDRESYAVAAGLALGLIVLGRGNSSVGLSDLHIENRLSEFMTGGNAASSASTSTSSSSSSSSSSAAARLARLMQEGKTSLIREQGCINTNVTAPGAILALGLMYLKTNNADVAARLSVPDTKYLLEKIRPDFLDLYVVAKNLIMWDHMEPTQEWIEAHVPRVVQERIGDDTKDKEELLPMLQIQTHIIAGACLSLGLGFAGTQNKEAAKVLSHFVKKYNRFREPAAFGSATQKADRLTIECALATCAQALGLVMAGSGDLDTLRVLRYTSLKVDKDIAYGHHMAHHMAIGMLFLGGGECSVSRSNESIAALLCAVFPIYPVRLDDNRYHLQAFRHLYVLAVEARTVHARDVDTGVDCGVPLEIQLVDQKQHQKGLQGHTPCLFPSFDQVSHVSVRGPRYWPVRTTRAWVEKHRFVYVKRKPGWLTYEDDPKGLLGLTTRFYPANASELKDFVSFFSGDPYIVAFAQSFCGNDGNKELSTFSIRALYDCLTRDKPEMLQTYMAIFESIKFLNQKTTSLSVWDLKLVVDFYNGPVSTNVRSDWTDDTLVPQMLRNRIDQRLKSFFGQPLFGQAIKAYVDEDKHIPGNLVTYLELPSLLRFKQDVIALLNKTGKSKRHVAKLVITLSLMWEHVPIQSIQTVVNAIVY